MDPALPVTTCTLSVVLTSNSMRGPAGAGCAESASFSMIRQGTAH